MPRLVVSEGAPPDVTFLVRRGDVTVVTDDTGLLGAVGSVVSNVVALALFVVVTAVFAGVLGLLWHAGLVALSWTGVVDLPVVTLGVAEFVGVPPVVRGVPLLYSGAAGLLSTLLLFATGNEPSGGRRHAHASGFDHDVGGHGGGMDGGGGGGGGGGEGP